MGSAARRIGKRREETDFPAIRTRERTLFGPRTRCDTGAESDYGANAFPP